MAWNTLLGWVSILVLVLGISMWAYAKCRGAFEVRSRRRHYLFLIIPGRTVTRELISGVSSELPLSFTKDRKLSYDLCPRAHDYTYYSINSGTRYFSATKDTAALVINLVAEIERMQSKQVLRLIVVPAFRLAFVDPRIRVSLPIVHQVIFRTKSCSYCSPACLRFGKRDV